MSDPKIHTQSIKKPTIGRWSILIVVLLLLAIYFLLPGLGEFRQSLVILRGANLLIVAVILILTLACFPLSTYTQLVAAEGKGTFKNILVMQLAGSFINCFLPFSVGTTTLLVEYYRSITKSRAQAFVIAYSPVMFNVALSLLLLALMSPITLSRISVELNIGPFIQWLIPVVIGVTIVLVIVLITYWKPFKKVFGQFIEGLKILGNPQLSSKLIALSLIDIVVNGLILWLCAHAVNLPLPFINAVILFIASLFVSGIVPTPGGIGATEATLAAGLVGSGLSLSDSMAIVLLYRLITFWLPLLPGVWALRRISKPN